MFDECANKPAPKPPRCPKCARSCGSCAERHGLTVCQSYLRLSAWPAEYFISRSDDAHGSHYNVASSRGHNGRRLARAWPLVLSSRYRAHADVKTPYRCGEMQQAPTHIKHCAELYDNPVHSVFLRHPQPYSGQDLRARHNRGVWRSAFVFLIPLRRTECSPVWNKGLRH